MPYQLVIFDFDGTLANTFPFFLRTLNTLAAAYGFKRIEPAEVDALRGHDVRQMMRHVGLPVWKLPFVARSFIRRMAREAHLIPLFDGVPQLLAELAAQGVQLAVVSANSEANIRRVLGPAACYVRYYAGGTALFGKARKFRQILRQSQAAPSHTLCIGDEPRDTEAAYAVGAACGVVAWGYTHLAALTATRPVLVFQTIADIRRHALAGPDRHPAS